MTSSCIFRVKKRNFDRIQQNKMNQNRKLKFKDQKWNGFRSIRGDRDEDNHNIARSRRDMRVWKF